MKLIEKESVDVLIRDAGFRVTTPRRHIVSFLFKQNSPISIQEIVEGLKQKVDQVTIYRTVDSFKNAGLIREIDLRQGRPCYELADTKDDHHHVVCTKYDRVEDFDGCDYEKLAQNALKQVRGFSKIESHSFELFGLCNTCA